MMYYAMRKRYRRGSSILRCSSGSLSTKERRGERKEKGETCRGPLQLPFLDESVFPFLPRFCSSPGKQKAEGKTDGATGKYEVGVEPLSGTNTITDDRATWRLKKK